MSYQKDRDEFVGVIVGETTRPEVTTGDTPTDIDRAAAGVRLARLILRNAATHQRLAEAHCNGDLTARQERQCAAVCHRIKKACEPWGIKPVFSGDPRGATVKLILPSGRYNSWGGAEAGYCVPTR